jgi:carbon monoxide dehydrogenase subunit G
MSSLKIEERFSVRAPVERVWRFLLDPERIAPCLPGAELLEVENERTFHGQMKVKVGPVTVAYQGTIELTEIDEAARRVQMVGKGKEKGGAGSAKMTMESRLEPQDDGAVAIAVTSDVELAGRIVRFGRGMIQSVSAQLFKQFAGNVRQALEGSGEDAVAAVAEPAAAAAVAEAAPAAAEAAPVAAPAGEAAAAVAEAAPAVAEAAAAVAEAAPAVAEAAAVAAPAAEAAPAPDNAAGEAEATPEATPETTAEAPRAGEAAAPVAPAPAPRVEPPEPAAPAPTRAAPAPEARTGRELAPRTAEPVRALPLLFRALWDVLTGFFKRLLGRGR